MNADTDTTAANDAATALPLLRTWRAVYVFVVTVFIVYVVSLTWLSRAFRE